MRNPAFGRLVNLYRNRLIRLFRGSWNEYFAHPELMETLEFRAAAWAVASEMAVEVAKVNASSWRMAAAKSTNAKKIYAALQQEIQQYGLNAHLNRIARENADLITSLPQYVARKVSKHAQQLQQEGKRPEEIARELRRIAPHLAKSRIELISRTQISTSESQLTQIRSERIGINWYQWETSNDSRVRESHRNMNNVLVPWGEKPNPEVLAGEKSSAAGSYHAGSTFNCRCLALPLADLAEVKWPCRVFIGGRIQRLTRPQFVKASGIQIAA